MLCYYQIKKNYRTNRPRLQIKVLSKKTFQRNKTHKAYFIIFHKIYRNRRFGSKNPSPGIECFDIVKAKIYYKT